MTWYVVYNSKTGNSVEIKANNSNEAIRRGGKVIGTKGATIRAFINHHIPINTKTKTTPKSRPQRMVRRQVRPMIFGMRY